jgi:hypothetical protein
VPGPSPASAYTRDRFSEDVRAVDDRPPLLRGEVVGPHDDAVDRPRHIRGGPSVARVVRSAVVVLEPGRHLGLRLTLGRRLCAPPKSKENIMSSNKEGTRTTSSAPTPVSLSRISRFSST